MTTAILAVQGAFIEHKHKLKDLKEESFEIRRAQDLKQPFDRLILPGGESTVQAKLLYELGLFDEIKARIENGLPVLATCAGLILLAEKIDGTGDLKGLNPDAEKSRLAVEGLHTLPVAVKRNAYGRQLSSFFTRGKFGDFDDVPMTFIRAPYITQISDDCEVLSVIENQIVAVKYKNQLAVAFHPELDDDTRIHELFLKM